MQDLGYLFNVINMLVEGLREFLEFVPKALDYITLIIGYMPIPLVSFMLCIITARIIIMVSGRNA